MDPFGLPTGFAIPTDGEIDGLVTKAESLQQSFNALGDEIETRIGARYEELYGDMTDGVRSLPLTRDEVSGVMKAGDLKAKQEAKRFREGMLQLHDQAITEQLRQLHDVNEKLSGLMRVYPSPQAYLSSQHLGDPKRTEYLRQIEKASTAEVATMGRLAIATNNRALAAAVQSKLDSMPKESRPFTAGELAERIVGNDYAKLTLAAKKASNAFQNAINRQRALQRGHGDLHEKMKSALRGRQIDEYQKNHNLPDFAAEPESAAE